MPLNSGYLRSVIEHSGDAIYLLDAKSGRILDCNEQAVLMLGYSREELLKLSAGDLEVHHDKNAIRRIHESIKKDGFTNINGEHRRKNGEIFPVEIRLGFLDPDASDPQIVSNVRDVTERKRDEELLRESEQRYRSLFENMLLGVARCKMIYDQRHKPIDFLYLSVNPAFFRLTGLKKALGKKGSELIPGITETNPELLEVYGRVAESGVPESFEDYVEPLKNWFNISVYSPQRGEFVATFDNITERKEAAEKLRHLNQTLLAVRNISKLIVLGQERGVLLKETCRTLVDARGFERCWIAAFDTGEKMIAASEEGWGADFEAVHAEMESGRLPYCAAEAVRTRKTIIRSDNARSTDVSDFRPDEFKDTARSLVAPMLYGNRIMGVISASVPRHMTVEAEEINIFQEMADDIGFALNNLEMEARRREAEDSLAEEIARRRSLFNQTPVGILIIDPETARFLEFNTVAHEQLGYTREEFAGLSIHDVEAEETPNETKNHISEILRLGRTVFETRQRTKAGDIRDIQVTIKVINISGRRVYQAVWQDITERKQAEDARRKSSAELQLLYEAGQELSGSLNLKEICRTILNFISNTMPCDSMMVSTYDAGSQLLSCLYSFDKKLAEIDTSSFPQIPLEPEGKGTQSLVIRSGQPLLLPDYEAYRRTASTSYFISDAGKLERNIPDDAERTRSAILVPLKNEGRVVGVVQVFSNRLDAFTRDHLRLVESLAAHASASISNAVLFARVLQQQSYIETVLENSPIGFAVNEIESGIAKFVSSSFEEIYGIPHGSVRDIDSFYNTVYPDPEYRQQIREQQTADISSRDPARMRWDNVRLISRTGEIKFITASNIPVYDMGLMVSTVQDVTAIKLSRDEQNRLREKAEMAGRLAAVGEMAAGVAHEINNPLTSVLGFSELLLEQDLPEKAKRQAQFIADGSQRVAEIIKRLLTFARQNKPARKPVDINSLIENTLTLRSYVLQTAGIRVMTCYDPHLPVIMADPGLLQQVFMNLIVNAEHAIKSEHRGGNLNISTERNGDKVRITFRDDGPGIKSENMARLFEPFFTTKGPNEGTGLGLSISHSIIAEHGGELRAESQPGKGATFIIELPVAEAPATSEAETPAARSAESRPSPVRVLVVDDEPSVGNFISAALAGDGHQVDATCDPDEAPELLDRNEYGLVFMDIRMPGMSGDELYEKTIQKHPDLAKKVVFMTGDASDRMVQSFLRRNNLPFMTKPFEIKELKNRVRQILEPESPDPGPASHI